MPGGTTHQDGAVYQFGMSKNLGDPRRWKNRHHDAGSDQVRASHKAPIYWIVVDRDYNLVGRLRRPADILLTILLTVAPIDPSRGPYFVRDPRPTDIGVAIPVPVVVGNPAPIGFLIIGDPVPAIIVCIDPMTHRIGTPVARTMGRNPHVAKSIAVAPTAVGLERDTKISRNRGGLCDRRRAQRVRNKCSNDRGKQNSPATAHCNTKHFGLLEC